MAATEGKEDNNETKGGHRKMSITTISKFETLMKEHEKELLDTNIDMKIEKFKSEVSNSVNNTFSTLNSNNSPSYYY